MRLLKDFGKREALIYLIVFLWISMGILAAIHSADFMDLSIYFGSLTAYAATYIWAESKRPSKKTGILQSGPASRREIMIYFIVFLWSVAGFFAIWYMSNLEALAMYFVSLTGFVASWIAGEVYTPQDKINNKDND